MQGADAYPFRPQPAALRFALAVLAVSLVRAVDAASGALIDDGSHFLLLATAVLASAWFAGTGPALLATVAGALLGTWEAQSSSLDARAAGTHLALFVVQGLLVTALVSELRRARRVAEREAHEALTARREGEAASRMKDEFLATVSHELRTPLNAVLGWLHLLRTGKLDAQTAARGIESIERNVRLQARLTGDLLDVSKALTGTLQLESRPVSLADTARQAVMAAVPAAHAKGVQVTSEIPDEAVPVLGDATRLRQIAWHLLANAIKFTDRGGSVALMVRTTRASAVLTVYDSGPGISPEFLPRIFDRFTQQDASPTRTVGGLGVGLSLVRDLVELQGGEISVRNRTGQPGAVFTARFPLHPTASVTTRFGVAGARCSSSPAQLDGLRVLVLERDADARELLRTVLQQQGAAVHTSESVADALEALEGWHPDVLVSDATTPERDSYALVGTLHALEPARGGRIPAAALTSAVRTDERVRRMLAPCLAQLVKPVDPAILTAEIARVAGRERRRAQRNG